MKLFAKLRSCWAPNPTLPPEALPSEGGSFRPQLHSDAKAAGSQTLIKSGKRRWQPTLSIIMEDRVDDDHHNDINNNNNNNVVAHRSINKVVAKPHKKSSVTLSSLQDRHIIWDRRKSIPAATMFPEFPMF